MIASVRGVVRQLNPDSAVVEVGGLGIAVQCAPATLANLRVGQAAAVATSLVVREDSLTLFGFADDDERATFELLLTASGVGPKLAQAMLSMAVGASASVTRENERSSSSDSERDVTG